MQKYAAANIVSFHLSQILMKHGKLFFGGTLEVAESLISAFKKHWKITTMIRDIPLSRPNITRKVELIAENVVDQKKVDLQSCMYFCLQIGVSVLFLRGCL